MMFNLIYLFIRINLGGRNLIYTFSIAKKSVPIYNPLDYSKLRFYLLNQGFFVIHVAMCQNNIAISR